MISHFDGTHSLSTTELATWPDYPAPSSKLRLLPAELRLHLSLLLRPPAAPPQPMVPWVVIPGEDRCIQRSLAPHSTQATLPLALRMPPPLSPSGVTSTPCPPPPHPPGYSVLPSTTDTHPPITPLQNHKQGKNMLLAIPLLALASRFCSHPHTKLLFRTIYLCAPLAQCCPSHKPHQSGSRPPPFRQGHRRPLSCQSQCLLHFLLASY